MDERRMVKRVKISTGSGKMDEQRMADMDEGRVIAWMTKIWMDSVEVALAARINVRVHTLNNHTAG